VINVPDGAMFSVYGGAFAVGGNGAFTGAGTNLFDVGSVATFTSSQDYLPNHLVINNATATFNGPGAVTAQNLAFNSGVLNGGQNMTVGGTMLWTAGTMSGPGATIIAPNATLSISNTAGDVVLFFRTLDNAGTVNWLPGAGALEFLNSGVITNEPGARFELQNPKLFYFHQFGDGGPVRFDNAGTLQIPGGGATAISGIPLNNYGLVDMQGGTLLINSGTNAGVINVPDGAMFSVYGGAFAVGGNGAFTGAGTNLFDVGSVATFTSSQDYLPNHLVINNATATFNGPGAVTAQNLVFNSGVLNGGQNVTVGGTMLWTAGTMSGPGETIIAPNATLSISNTAGDVVLFFRTLDNAGTVNWLPGAGALEFLNSGVVTNEPGGRFVLQNPRTIYFHQFGDGGPVRFDNAGTLQIPGGGTTAISGIPLNNYHFIDLHTGALAVNGGYNSTPNSMLYSALAGTVAGINYGQLLLSGTVTLAGTVSVGLTDGYVPATNTAFTLVTAGTRNGMFSNFQYPSNQVALTLTNSPTAVIAIVTNDFVPSGQILPVLGSAGFSASAASLSWSTNYPDFQLQYNASLASNNWTAYPYPPVVIGTNFVATDLWSNAPQFFFRLSGQ
jgi:hypothetical protein